MNYDLEEQNAIKYFFGELSDAELTAFEEKFFTEDEFSDWLAEFEADLIDDYLRGELSATEKMKFEEKYLVSERRQERVKAAATFWEKEKAAFAVTVVETQRVSLWQRFADLFAVPQLAFAAPVILLLILIGGLFFFLRQPLPTEIVEKGKENINILPTPEVFPSVTPENSPQISPSPTVSPTVDRTPVKTPTVKPTPSETPRQIEPPSPTLATIILFPSLRSDGEAKKIVLKKETKTLYIRLNRDLDQDFAKYLAEVRDEGGNLMLSQNLSAKKSLAVSIPAKNLLNGNYRITLKGAKADEDFKTISFYNFLVEKK